MKINKKMLVDAMYIIFVISTALFIIFNYSEIEAKTLELDFYSVPITLFVLLIVFIIFLIKCKD